MSPQRFFARLCALVPSPGAHIVRYCGVLASRHALRARIIPTVEAQGERAEVAGLPPRARFQVFTRRFA